MFYAIAYLVDIEIQDVDRRNIIAPTIAVYEFCELPSAFSVTEDGKVRLN